jgi:hypothetical protein
MNLRYIWNSSTTELDSVANSIRSIGVTAPLASITLVRTLSFSIYQRSKYVYSDWMGRHLGFRPLDHANRNGAYPTLGSFACFGAAGATAGSGITFIACKSIAPMTSFRWKDC